MSETNSILASRPGRDFLPWYVAAIVLLVFAGFARTFYLHSLFGMKAPSQLLTWHATLMTGWIVMLAIQAGLALARGVHWHRRLGWAAAFYVPLMIALGCMATVGAATREIRAHSALVAGQLDVLSLELTQLTLFAGFFYAAVWMRKRTGYHKRLMLLATFVILPNAIVRLVLLAPYAFLHRNVVILSMWVALTLIVVAVDSYRGRHLHPAFGYGLTIAIAALYLANGWGYTQSWRDLATRLLS